MSTPRGLELSSASHNVEDFDCGDDVLNGWLRRRAARNQREGSSRVWDVAQASQVVAYYASSTAVVARSEATRRAARNQPDPIPAMLLGRLAVDLRHQGEGLAASMLRHFLLTALEVADLTGLRLVVVHAKDDRARGFYRHFGFEASPIDDLTLMLLIKDLRA